MADITELYPELNFYDNYKRHFELQSNKVDKKENITFTCEERKEYDNTKKPAEK